MDDDLFTYEVNVANIPCDSKIDDVSEHEADDDMGFDPSDIAFTEWNYSEMRYDHEDGETTRDLKGKEKRKRDCSKENREGKV
ncbi:hypothetical protein Tco_0954336 [Tanacetum coccineum]|uniref:Uncharacterized protein n=1 Tax=Tanacetum coccineum TaxID=301880 RepID=A0ABQ5E2F0_9ASTR